MRLIVFTRRFTPASKTPQNSTRATAYTVGYDTICYFDVQSKADMSQLKLVKTTARNQQLKSGKTEKLKSKQTDMLRSIGKQSGESVHSVLKKKRKDMVGRICRMKE